MSFKDALKNAKKGGKGKRGKTNGKKPPFAGDEEGEEGGKENPFEALKKKRK